MQRERETKSVFTNVENEEGNSSINDENFLKSKRYYVKGRTINNNIIFEINKERVS